LTFAFRCAIIITEKKRERERKIKMKFEKLITVEIEAEPTSEEWFIEVYSKSLGDWIKTKSYPTFEEAFAEVPNAYKEIVKRAAIAFAFAKKLPFLNPGDLITEKYIVEAYNTLGFEGNTYKDIQNASPIYLGFGKDAYYSKN
jgi:hypothetical protein